MDPTANLARQLELAHEIIDLTGEANERVADVAELARLAHDLADHTLALDSWRRAGGFDPYAAAARRRMINTTADSAIEVADEFRDLLEATAHAGNLPVDDSPGGALVEIGTRLSGYVRGLAPRARAWDAIDEALTRNKRGEGHASAADVCAVGFALQLRLGKDGDV